MAFKFMKKISPEYVLENAIADVKASGIEGLKPYLTEEAQKKVERVQTVSNELNVLSSLATGSESTVKMLVRKLSECDFSVDDLIKGSESAKGIVRFKYEDCMEGTVELSMIKEDKEWKIDKVEMPNFEKIDVTVTAEVQNID